MKSTELYAVLREEVGPWARAQGFRRAKSMLSWYRACQDEMLVFWFQASSYGWDPYTGSQFTVEFQRNPEPVVGKGLKRERIGRLLDDSQREQLRELQNLVIAALPHPPRDHFMFMSGEQVATHYRRRFEPVTRPYTTLDDIWLRYHDLSHVQMWGRFVLGVLPCCVEQVERW
jgi:hypothetical protein